MDKKTRPLQNSLLNKILLGTIGLVISVMSISTCLQISTQRSLLNSEYRQQQKFAKEKLMERGKSMAYHLAIQGEDALASYNLYSYIKQLEKSIKDTKDLNYVIVMDITGMAHIHTRHPRLQETRLKNPEDIFAMGVTAPFTTNEFTRDGHNIIEFISPLTVGTGTWGILRLGYSLDNLNRIITESQKTIARQTREMLWKSLIIATVLILFSALVVAMFATRMIRPLTELAETARALSMGKFSDAEKILIPAEDEIGILTTAFKEMAVELKISYSKLEEYSRTLEKKVKSRTSELVIARDEALNATKSKTEFLARMSHEIRNPMNAILGMADLLWETRLTEEQQRYVQVFRNSGETLMALINDILDLSKVEAGCITFENSPFNMGEVAGKCCELMALKAHTKGIELVLCIKPDTPLELVGDPAKLRQVLMNILDNALKFTQHGEIVLDIHEIKGMNKAVASSDKPQATLEFSVRDTGIGIAEEEQTRIFEPFIQASSTTNKIHGGTGLGLSICRQLVRAMKGDIKLTSSPHRGSTFTFNCCFPLQLDSSSPKQKKTSQLLSQKILILDDNQSAREMMDECLTAWGATVEKSSMVSKGVSKLKKALHKNQPFDTILLDTTMAGVNIFDLTRQIKEMCNPAPHIVLMLTSINTTEQIEKTRSYNISSYLFKPVTSGELLKKISYTPAKSTPVPLRTSTHQLPPHIQHLKILLAEDAEENQLIITTFLRHYPCDIDIAENGAMALAMVTTAHTYDLILMDIQMPVMDGHEATRAIRQWEKENNKSPIPIIALTAHAFDTARQQCFDDGCTGYLTKPIKKSKLLHSLAEISTPGNKKPGSNQKSEPG